MTERPGSPPLLEREPELEAIEQALAAAERAEGALVVIEGEAGIGKSSLLEHAATRARSRGMRALSARGSELEREFPLGVVLQLLSEPLESAGSRERRALLEGPAALASPLLEAREPADLPSAADSIFPLLHGLHWLVAALCERRPLLISVDDAQWADAASLTFLNFLAPRLAGLAATIVAAVRAGEAGPGEQLRLGQAAQTLRPLPLGAKGVQALVRRTFPGADEAFCAACGHATGGNPLYLASLLASAAAEGIDPVRDGTSALAGLGPPEIAVSVDRRLGRLGTDPRRLAEAVAILGDGASPPLARQLAGLDGETGSTAADQLAVAGLLRVGVGLSFAHPLVREAVLRGIPAARRARAHRRAAELLLEREERSPRVAAQLLRAEAGGDAWAREVLVRAAREASELGSPSVARDYLVRALQEGPPEAERGKLTAELALAEAALDADAAWQRLGAGLPEIGSALERGRFLRDFALRAFGTRRFLVSAERLWEEAGAVGGEDAELAAELEALALVSEAYGLSSTQADSMARMRDILAREELVRNPAGRALVGQAASTAALRGHAAEEVASLARRAIAEARRFEDPDDLLTAGLAANSLTLVDQLDEAEQVLGEAIQKARRAGRALPYAVLSHCRAINRYRAGRVTDAVADAESAVAGYVHGWHWGLPGSHAYLCQAYLERGELERAAAALELPEGEEAWSDSILWMLYLEARGRLALERRAPEAALAEFRRAGELAESMQLENPAVLPWRARAAEAMRALGRDAEARRLADEDLRRARAFGTPWGLGVCLRARGLVEGGTDAVDWLRQAVEALEQGPNRLERSRALVDLGAALRRAGRKREARDTLRHGMNLARDCEALALVRRAEEELRASGARLVQRELSGVEGLTPSERRVAHMAASGMSNREIAAALFVTLRTVETHLTHSYRKLEVDSRAELRKRLSPEARSNLVVRPR